MLRFLVFLMIALLPLQAFAQDKALERIVKNQEINCGVYALGSIFSYDSAGKPKGFTPELFQEITARTGLKVKYTEISSFATLAQDMETGKFDMICAPTLFFPSTAMKFLPSLYIARDEIDIYTSADKELPSDLKIEGLNQPKYKFVGMDGELGGIYVPKMFPQATLTMLPFGAAPGQMFLELQTKKADFIMLTRVAGKAFLKENPNKIKLAFQISNVYPSLRLFYPAQSHQLKANLDAVLEEIEREGITEKLLKKHDLLF